MKNAPIIIFEGILSFYDERIRDLMDLKIFVYTDDDVRLQRRLLRDTKERGRSIASILTQYNLHVKKAYDEFIRPTMKYADIIVPKGKSNVVAIELIAQNIELKLRNMGISPALQSRGLSLTSETTDIEELVIKGLKNVITIDDDITTMNEILIKLMMQRDCGLNK